MVNPAYSLNLSGLIHLPFTVTRRSAARLSGFRRVSAVGEGIVLRPFVFGIAMRTKYLADELRQQRERRLIDFDAGIDVLSGNETSGENLRHVRTPLPGRGGH